MSRLSAKNQLLYLNINTHLSVSQQKFSGL